MSHSLVRTAADRQFLPRDRAALAGARTALPGVGVALVGGVLALWVHREVPTLGSAFVAIVLGAVAVNLRPVSPALRPGLAYAQRRVLRIGVALLGLQVALDQVLGLGVVVLAVVVGVVVGGIVGIDLLGRRLGVAPHRRLLIACGFSICGAAAAAAVHEVARPDRSDQAARPHRGDRPEDSGASDGADSDQDLAAAILLVVLCGSLTMLALPLLARLLGLAAVPAGAWAGGAIHEVGQVVVAGGLLGPAALQVAVLVKLCRVLLLAPVITVVSGLSGRSGRTGRNQKRGRLPVSPVPGFVLGFVALAAAATWLPATVLPTAMLDAVLDAGIGLGDLALATAMCALGTAIDLRTLRRIRRADLTLALLGTGWVVGLAAPLLWLV